MAMNKFTVGLMGLVCMQERERTHSRKSWAWCEDSERGRLFFSLTTCIIRRS